MSNTLINKLYPPYIEGALPAFSDDKNLHPILKIQYSLNRGVTDNNIKGYSLLIKKITTNQIIGTSTSFTKINDVICFDLFDINLIKGQYYKVQLAFIDKEGVVGYYSTPSLVKYIEEPILQVLDFNIDTMKIQGIYKPENSGEYLYSTRFCLKDQTGLLLEDSGNLLYNSSNIDESNNSIIEYNFKYIPTYGQRYRAYIEITTGNNYMLNTNNGEDILAMPSVNPEIQLKVIANNIYEEGIIKIAVEPLTESKSPVTGAFVLGRATNKDNFKSYEPILKFEFINEIPKQTIYKDLFVEHGIEYKYAIQQYNENNIYSKKVWSNLTQAWFEDLFLTDGKQQLKIKYNPKVSSIKTTVQESKVDTLGGQYPFIFRNGNVKYKELPISGLISYLSDDSELFFVKPDNFEKTTNLTDENIYMESLFKNEVANWLNNGEVKFFKSPIEGSLLVRLMNVSLAPNDTLGRMLHTFNCTAYEIGELNYNNLIKYDFINSNQILKSNNTVSIEEFNLIADSGLNFKNVINLEFLVNYISEDDVSPTNLIVNSTNIVIPANIKSYQINLPMSEVTVEADKECRIICYSQNTESAFNNNFNTITNIKPDPSITIAQFNFNNPTELDVLEAIKNKETNKEIAFFAYLQFYKNPDLNQPKDYYIKLNGTPINIENTGDYLLRNVDYVNSLTIGAGVVLECGYYLNEIVRG